MRVATYARYSSDRQRETSIQDQMRNCDRHAAREGWTITARFKDQAISGSTADRPGYQEMLAAAKARQFDVLIVDDLSRLARDEIEVKMVVRRFKHWGLRLIGVSDGVDSDVKSYKLNAGIRGLMGELFLDELAEKTRRGLMGRALAGMSAGGRAFGYRHRPIFDPKRKDEYGRPVIISVKREVDPVQAKWVRWIFERYALGDSPRQIAIQLNAKGIKSPRGKAWGPGAIYGDVKNELGILNNASYRGVARWNRGRWQRDPDTDKMRRIAQPEDQWVVVEQPELRIVSDDLWQRVKARQQEQQRASIAIVNKLGTKARTGRSPKFLFSSLLKCGVCGGTYSIMNKKNYACATNFNGGEAACKNKVRVSRHVVEERLLDAIKADLFTDEGLGFFKKEVRRVLAERRASKHSDGAETQRNLARVEAEIGNLVKAIKAGILTVTTKQELEKCEAERAALTRQLGANPADNIETLLPRTIDRYRDLVANLERVVSRDMSRARHCIRALVGGEIKLMPGKDGHLDAHVQGDYAGLVALIEQAPGAGVAAAQLSHVSGSRFD